MKREKIREMICRKKKIEIKEGNRKKKGYYGHFTLLSNFTHAGVTDIYTFGINLTW
jgi:hypothetical protein